jgi:hypothetical protein
MSTYVCILFSGKSAVVDAESIDQLDDRSARQSAEAICAARPDVSGYELWAGGQKVFSRKDLKAASGSKASSSTSR